MESVTAATTPYPELVETAQGACTDIFERKVVYGPGRRHHQAVDAGRSVSDRRKVIKLCRDLRAAKRKGKAER